MGRSMYGPSASARLRYHLRAVPTLCALSLLLAGCTATKLRTREVQSVAKDWVLTIRASQVIPIYPLMEDLQPGDVFLVTTPIQRQAEQYREEGFLPLDQHLARLEDLDYLAFYNRSFGTGGDCQLPDCWRFPDGATDWAEPAGQPRARGRTVWTRAPRAFFPSYNFKVLSGRGLSLALPVQSVPLGLSLMGTDAATGSVTLKDAFTYGVSLEELQAAMEPWQHLRSTKELLESQRVTAGRQIYVRIISRVYLVGGIKVSLTNDRAFGAEIKAGKAPKLEVPILSDQEVQQNLEKLRKAAAADPTVEAGGAVKIHSASGRAVSADETLDRPLVVGYLSFDFPVMEGGELGPPATTVQQLLGQVQRKPVGLFEPVVEDFGELSRLVKALQVEVQAKVLDAAARRLTAKFQENYEEAKKLIRAPWDAFDVARGRNTDSLEIVNRALRKALDAAFQHGGT